MPQRKESATGCENDIGGAKSASNKILLDKQIGVEYNTGGNLCAKCMLSNQQKPVIPTSV